LTIDLNVGAVNRAKVKLQRKHGFKRYYDGNNVLLSETDLVRFKFSVDELLTFLLHLQIFGTLTGVMTSVNIAAVYDHRFITFTSV